MKKRICPPQKKNAHDREGGFTASATSAIVVAPLGMKSCALMSLCMMLLEWMYAIAASPGLADFRQIFCTGNMSEKRVNHQGKGYFLLGKLFILEWIWNHDIFMTQQSSESSAMGIMYCLHSQADQTDLSLWRPWWLTYPWDMQKIGEFGSCKPSLLKLFHCTSMFHPQVRFFPYNLENFFSSLMT